MSGLKIPLTFSPENFYEKNLRNLDKNDSLEKSIKKSINDFIKLLVTSPKGSYKPDMRFGYSLRNCHFENANSKDEIKGKKICGKSETTNNYAYDLGKAIALFEPRLQFAEVKTDFERKQAKITISITGLIAETKKEYQQDLEFYIWKNNANF